MTRGLRTCGSLAMFLGAAALTWTATQAQDSPPPQSISEAQLAQEFKKAASVLFQEWATSRPLDLERMATGRRNTNTSECMGNGYWQFFECREVTPPSGYKIDVTKTDSVLTPYIGHLYISVNETCTVRNVVPKGMSWGEKALRPLDASCIGKSYDDCIAAGGKPGPKMACVKGPEFTFPFAGPVHLTYVWSEGKWEFQDDRSERPTPPNDKR